MRKPRKPYIRKTPKKMPWYLIATPTPDSQLVSNEIAERLDMRAVLDGTATEKQALHVLGVIRFALLALPYLEGCEIARDTLLAGQQSIEEILHRIRGGRKLLNVDIVKTEKAFEIGLTALAKFDRHEIDRIIYSDFVARGSTKAYDDMVADFIRRNGL